MDLKLVSTKDLKDMLNDLLLLIFTDDITEHELELVKEDIREIRWELIRRQKG